MLIVTLKIAGIPLLRPLHRLAGELLAIIYDDSMEGTCVFSLSSIERYVSLGILFRIVLAGLGIFTQDRP